MAITQAMATSFKVELMDAYHNFGTGPVRASEAADTFYMSLYTATATLDATTTVYTSSNETTGTGYTAGGIAVTNGTSPTATNSSATAGVAFWTPSASLTYTSVTLSTAFDTVLIYNSSKSNYAVSVHTFGAQTVTAGTFTLTMPTNDSTNALIRIA